MENVFNRIIIGMGIIILLLGVSGITYLYFEITDDRSLQEKADKQEAEEAKEVVSDEVPMDSKIEVEVETTTSEYEFQQNIHEMTHQKVYADDKWGSLEITDERIDEMIMILDKSNFENEDFFRETLTAWDEGNFGNAVSVHNEIWSLQGGTVGKAKRLLTKEEEQDYIELKFD